jgi:hypothetical protein
VIGGRRLFAAGAVALFTWTAAIEFVLRGSAGAPTAARASTEGRAAREPRPSVVSPPLGTGTRNPAAPVTVSAHAVLPSGGPHAARPEPSHPSAAANNASDPAAAGPAPVEDAAVARIVDRWCAAYVRWGENPRGGAAVELRSLSTPGLYASLAARPPTSAAVPVRTATVEGVQTFTAPGGYSAIVDLDGDGADVVIDLTIASTRLGPLVSSISL